MLVSITLEPIGLDPISALQDWNRLLAETPEGPAPAEATFIGRVRSRSHQGTVLKAMELEHYPGMTERCLRELAEQCAQAHGVMGVLVCHRVGQVLPGDAIVLVAVAADRRGAAQRCCQQLLEALKHEAPFWKREHQADGTAHWVQGNTPC